MDFERLSEQQMTVRFFKNVIFAVWNTYDSADNFEFMCVDGSCYMCGHPKKLDRAFPVVKNLNWSKRGWENWTWYYMGMGGGAVFVRNDFLETYKLHAGIDDRYIEHFPDWRAAESALEEMIDKGLIKMPKKIFTDVDRAEILPDRADRFTWQPGDLVVYSSMDEMIETAKKEGRTVRLYGHNGAPDTIISPD